MGEKKRILRDEYGIPVEGKLEREVDAMGSICMGYWKEGLVTGRAEGRAAVILNMLAGGEPMEKIVNYSGVSREEIIKLKNAHAGPREAE